MYNVGIRDVYAHMLLRGCWVVSWLEVSGWRIWRVGRMV